MAAKIYVDPLNGSTEEYRKKLQQIAEQGIDPFAKNHLRDFDSKEIILETKHWFVFNNQHAYADTKYQLVIVAQEYKEIFSELTNEEKLDLFAVAEKLCERFSIDGGGITMRFGNTKKSGATVKRLHAQIIFPEDGKQVAAWFGSKS